MSPGTSADTATPTAPAAWLKAQTPQSGRWIAVAVGLAFANGVLLILQAWLLARTVHAVVFADAGLAEAGRWL